MLLLLLQVVILLLWVLLECGSGHLLLGLRLTGDPADPAGRRHTTSTGNRDSAYVSP
jgi:hypothetical protein